ncbi:MAG: TniQ family protein [Streptosporangiales bacterium]
MTGKDSRRSTLSPLPRSLDPLPDESLPGYLLRLAHRLGLAPARVMQLTGLTAGRDRHQPARQSLMLHLDEAPAGAFARVTRLTATETARLCMSSISGQYPWAAPRVTADQWGPRSLASPWVFTAATRYCPQCLAGDGSLIQQQHGGAWQKAWRLPVVFTCPAHRLLLEHLCPSCRQPAMSAAPGAPAWLIPRARDHGLHPAQCRAALQPQATGRRARPCGARLNAPARAGEDARAPDDLLALQDRLLQLLRAGEPAAITSVGQPATPAQYFADLRLVCSLINGAWPHSQTLITGPGMAEYLGRHITSTGGTATRRHTLCDIPPLDARPGAALITAAVRILDGGDLRVLSEFLAPARDGASRKSPRGRWLRRYRRAGHDCSDGFRDALEPLVNSFQRADRRSRGRRAPAPQITFAPEHVPGHLQDDWHYEHFRHISGNTRLLRRAAALRLVQMSAGGSLAEAAAFLGIDHRYLKASPGSAAFADDPAQFRLAVHALARQLSATPHLINYKRRRDALQDWCVSPATWQDIVSQLPPTKGPFQPELSDCKRQFASEAIWARVTQGEHLLAPRIIEHQLSAGDPTWHRRRDNMWHFYLATPPKPHYAALRKILNAYADGLSAAINRDHSQRPRQINLGNATYRW